MDKEVENYFDAISTKINTTDLDYIVEKSNIDLNIKFTFVKGKLLWQKTDMSAIIL